jgi:hypothetical protein
MENRHYHIAERNNYFLGKLMTVRDFSGEQTYFNSKRRLGNRMLTGPGIVMGLDVFLIDDKTFSLDTGFAVDYLGREIVVPQPCIRKLNVIKGFEENKENGKMYLCIAYKEKLSETTFSVAGSGKSDGSEKQYNRIKESYELFLTSKSPKKNKLKIDNFVYKTVQIFDKEGVKIRADFPRYTNPNKQAKIKVYFEKERQEEPVNFSFKVSGELFKGTEGDGFIAEFKETEVSNYKTQEMEYFIFCTAQDDASSQFMIDKNLFNLTIGKNNYEIEKTIEIPVLVRTKNIFDLIVLDYYSHGFDKIIEDVDESFIYLAKFYLVTDQLNYFIESFIKHPFKQYVYNNDLLRLMTELNQDNSKMQAVNHKGGVHKENAADGRKEKEQTETETVQKSVIEKDNIITGVEKINLGFNAKIDKSYYSYELVHGLGLGPVGIIASTINDLNEDLGENSLLIFGDKSVFSDEELKASVPNVQIAAAANPEKGTFRLGVRLKSKTFAQSVDIRWWAFRPIQSEEEKENLIIDETMKVIIKPNTARVKPLGRIRFKAEIKGSNDQRIRWEMAEENTGNIDSNGLYIAPATEGVYEIKAQSVKVSELHASCYAVVSAAED